MNSAHLVKVGEQWYVDVDDAGERTIWLETWVSCLCGWEDGTWGSDVNDPESVRQVRGNRSGAIDAHMAGVR
jgi:hypothetical protein